MKELKKGKKLNIHHNNLLLFSCHLSIVVPKNTFYMMYDSGNGGNGGKDLITASSSSQSI